MSRVETDKDGFGYKDNFDSIDARAKLGLDGDLKVEISRSQKENLATELWRRKAITEEEIEGLGMKIKRADSCPEHLDVQYFVKVPGHNTFVCPYPLHKTNTESYITDKVPRKWGQ